MVLAPLAEAPVSITAHILVTAISRDTLLVTGRGVTAQEAVTNLHEAIAAVKAQPQPLSLVDKIAPLLAISLKDACEYGHAHDLARIINAATIVLRGTIEQHDSAPASASVRSSTHANLWHTCIDNVCSCPDWGRHKHQGQDTYVCQHLLAVQWWRSMQEHSPSEQQGEGCNQSRKVNLC